MLYETAWSVLHGRYPTEELGSRGQEPLVLVLLSVQPGEPIIDCMKANVETRARNGSAKVKVTRSATLGGYVVTGWRNLDDACWHVKVWLEGRPSDWLGYTVTAGRFELETGAKADKEAVLHAISEWEAE